MIMHPMAPALVVYAPKLHVRNVHVFQSVFMAENKIMTHFYIPFDLENMSPKEHGL
jgi:hypothetical protein